MKLDNEKIIKLENFLLKLQGDTYPEPISEPHLSITKKMLDGLLNKYHCPTGSKILDVGCGQGVALELFLNKGYHPIGIALNDEDIAVCQQKGYQAYKMDQSLLETIDISFEVPAGPDTYWAFFQQK